MKYISLTQNKTALVCDCHYSLVAPFKWYFSNRGYAIRHTPRPNRVAILMHRVINDTPPHLQTDHRDRNRLNNQCSNLHSVTFAENAQNKPTTYFTRRVAALILASILNC